MSDAASPGIDIPEKSWTNPFTPGTWLYDKFEETVRQEKDLIIILDDSNVDRGTGKTVGSLQLANGMDQTPHGVTTSKATIRAEEFRNAYVSEPKRSGLVLDEAEYGASNRDAMTSTNKALREVMSMGRVEQKYVVVNTPTIEFIDRDLRKLAHVWMSMVRKGLALVHELDWEPYSSTLLRPKKQWFEFEDIPTESPLRDVYNDLTRQKRRILAGDDGPEYVTRSELNDKLQTAREDARREERDRIIHNLFAHDEIIEAGVTQQWVAEAVGLDPSRVSQILRDE